jgi:Bacterial regulatory helix-turn-helix protein, lysR family
MICASCSRSGTRAALSGAARALGVNHSTVFRRIGALETRLGVRLFEHVVIHTDTGHRHLHAVLQGPGVDELTYADLKRASDRALEVRHERAMQWKAQERDRERERARERHLAREAELSRDLHNLEQRAREHELERILDRDYGPEL